MGAFSIEDSPRETYSLKAWDPLLWMQERKLTGTPEESVSLKLSLPQVLRGNSAPPREHEQYPTLNYSPTRRQRPLLPDCFPRNLAAWDDDKGHRLQLGAQGLCRSRLHASDICDLRVAQAPEERGLVRQANKLHAVLVEGLNPQQTRRLRCDLTEFCPFTFPRLDCCSRIGIMRKYFRAQHLQTDASCILDTASESQRCLGSLASRSRRCRFGNPFSCENTLSFGEHPAG